MIKSGNCNALSLQNQLLNAYVKCKQFNDACRLFDEMLVKNVVTWNILMCGFADSGRNLRSFLCLNICYFKRMLMEMVGPDYITCMSLLRTCVQLNDIGTGRQLYCFIQKYGLCTDCFVNSALVDLYAKLGFVVDSRRVFDCAVERDLVLWNVMVSCYALNHLGEEAFGVFDLMRLEGVKGDDFMYTTMLNICANFGSGNPGRQIHGLVVKLGLDLDVVLASSLVDMYAKSDNIVGARMAFDGMVFRNVISWTSMIVGYGQYGDGKEAMKLLGEMLQEDYDPGELALSSVLSSCGNLSLPSEIVQVHSCAIKNGFATFPSVANALTNAYSKCGSFKSAVQCFNSVPEPDLVSWTSVISACAFHGLSKEAIELFENMLSSGVRPDGIAFLEVLSACSHGCLIEEGLHYFNLMAVRHEIVPASEHYTCLVDLLGRVGFLNEAFNALISMPMEPGSDTLGAFIGSCKVHGNAELAKWAVEKLLVLEPNKPVNYALMSNMHAASGNWYDVARVRKIMRNKCYHKVPGISWIDIAGKVHRFLAGDKSHPKTVEIYAVLTKLLSPTKEEDFTMAYGLMDGYDWG